MALSDQPGPEIEAVQWGKVRPIEAAFLCAACGKETDQRHRVPESGLPFICRTCLIEVVTLWKNFLENPDGDPGPPLQAL